jgi:protein-L-isoaspartate O-methyltransferase
VENKAESRLAGDIYTITRNTLLSDDFAQAVNIGCASVWHINDAWPNFAEIAGLGAISSRAAITENPEDWLDDDTGRGYFGMP